MNSSVPPFRRIASNRLWIPAGVVCDPVVEVAPDGRILRVASHPDPDRLPLTEFYAGLLVPAFPDDYRAAFAALLAQRERPLEELLAALIPSDGALRGGALVVISGLDYAPPDRPGADPPACRRTRPLTLPRQLLDSLPRQLLDSLPRLSTSPLSYFPTASAARARSRRPPSLFP